MIYLEITILAPQYKAQLALATKLIADVQTISFFKPIAKQRKINPLVGGID